MFKSLIRSLPFTVIALLSLSTAGKNLLAGAYPSEVWIKLHTGTAGAEGTEHAAAETTRKSATLGAASAGVRKSSTAQKWGAFAAGEEIKEISLWSAATAGTCYQVITLETARAIELGGYFEMAAEALSVSVS